MELVMRETSIWVMKTHLDPPQILPPCKVGKYVVMHHLFPNPGSVSSQQRHAFWVNLEGSLQSFPISNARHCALAGYSGRKSVFQYRPTIMGLFISIKFSISPSVQLWVQTTIYIHIYIFFPSKSKISILSLLFVATIYIYVN